MHGFPNHKRRRPSTVASCSTCGRELKESERVECGGCRRDWQRAQRAPGFVPTIEMFPELVPVLEPEPEPEPMPDLFTPPTEG